MNKRKLRVLNILCVGALVSGLSMTLGVFAATRQQVSVNSSVSFKSTAVNADVSVFATDGHDAFVNNGTTPVPAGHILSSATATYLGQNYSCYGPANSAKISFAASETKTTKETSLALTLADLDKDMFILAGSTFTITYQIEKTGGADIYYCIKLVGLDTTAETSLFNTVEYSINGGITFENYNTTAGVTSESAITESSPTVAITFKYTIKSDICGTIPVANAGIGNYTIYMANSPSNLANLVNPPQQNP